MRRTTIAHLINADSLAVSLFLDFPLLTLQAFVLLSAFIVAGCSLHNQGLPTESKEQTERAILQSENRLAEALNALDDAALDVLWDDRLVFIGSNGHSSTKAQHLKGVRDARASMASRITSTNDDVRVQLVDTAAVTYVVSSWQGMDGAPSQQYRATHVWARENGMWKLVSAHVSKVAP